MKQIQRRTSVPISRKMLSRREAEMHQVNILWPLGHCLWIELFYYFSGPTDAWFYTP